MNEETFFMREERGWKGGCIFREENHLYISFRKVSALAFFRHIKEEF